MSNDKPDSGYEHFHELGRRKPPGYSIPERKAPDSGPGGLSGGKVGGERPAKIDPAPGGDPMHIGSRSSKVAGG